ncbi:LysM peptidoglycan-binding domain-containing protein [Streptococcus suis]|nr:LysM peptidoglycan-binding domain-containing protein [Streptococcus suis]
MAKKPWESKIFETKKDNGEQASRKEKNSGFLSTPLLTGLLSVFFLIVIGILIVVFYTSSGGSDEAKATSGFYRSSESQSKTKKASSSAKKSKKKSTATSSTKANDNVESSSSSKEETTTSSSSSEARDGQTIVVQAGEGATSIAARAGISVEQLEALNPDHMTLGYWYANPGDQVYIN